MSSKKKKIWVNIAHSFRQAQEFDDNYYQAMSKREKIETMQFLRDTAFKFNKELRNASRKGLQRVIKIIQQT